MSKYRRKTEDLAARFKALSNPARLRIFVRILECFEPGERCDASDDGMRRCVGELGKDLGIAPSTVSHHVKELRQAGLIRVERCGRSMLCWVDEDALMALADFFGRATTKKATRRGCAA